MLLALALIATIVATAAMTLFVTLFRFRRAYSTVGIVCVCGAALLQVRVVSGGCAVHRIARLTPRDRCERTDGDDVHCQRAVETCGERVRVCSG
jgi:hypothetical protein